MRQKGDILEASNRAQDAGRHYIVFYEGFDHVNFIGGMVTHMESERNIAMSQNHFEKNDEAGNSYKFQFGNTQLVIAKLMKFETWGPFSKVGALSEEGIQFIENIIDGLPQETWEEYLYRISK
jgi:hypothetical protein